MSYLVLARKYRPQTFDEVVAQEHVTRTLTNAIGSGRVAHALCFSGPRGTGKTTVARIFAKAMNCAEGPTASPCNQCPNCLEITAGNSVDVYEIDGASNNSVEQIRDLRENVKYAPASSPYKIYIIDEVHMLSVSAFNALLKTLEEPPSHVLFVLATTESHKIPVTILSRCQRYDFARIGMEDIVGHLRKLADAESFEIDDKSLWTVARSSGGCMRDALSLLDQVMAYATGPVTMDRVLEILGAADRRSLMELCGSLFNRNAARALELLDQLYSKGHDMKRLAADLTEHLRNCLVVKTAKNPVNLVDLPEDEVQGIRELVQGVDAGVIHQVLDTVFSLEPLVRQSTQPRLALEVAILRVASATPAVSMEKLILSLERLRQGIYSGDIPAPSQTMPAPPQSQVREPDADKSEFGPPSPPRERVKKKPVDEPPPIEDEDLPPMASEPDPHEDEPAAPPVPEPVPAESTRTKAPPAEAMAAFKTALKADKKLARHFSKIEITQANPRTIRLDARGQNFVFRLLGDADTQAQLKAHAEKAFGQAMNVEVVSTRAEGAENPAKRREADKKWRKKVMNHPLIADAMDLFEGVVVDVKKLD